MTYKSLLVHVDSSPTAAARVNLAISLAQAFDAHLTGLFVGSLPPMYADMGAFEVSSALKTHLEEYARQAQATFDSCTNQAGWASCEWRQTFDEPVGALCLNARYHDLVILGQTNPDQQIDNLPSNFPESVVLGAGRPALLVPYAGSYETIGQHVLVAWDEHQEAARALVDALPLLKQASQCTLLTVQAKNWKNEDGRVPGADIALYLARHGVQVEVKNEFQGALDIGNLLLSFAADQGVDLIVMGAYGHSRLREIILGGATQTILSEMTVPVLMSH
jgi:nucleotide-binding universal stress UspA family protein